MDAARKGRIVGATFALLVTAGLMSSFMPGSSSSVTPQPAEIVPAPPVTAPVTQRTATRLPETQPPETQSPQTPAPPTPAPETPAPETPAPETPAPETPAPETPAPETPAPETPAPETPAPETPAPETRPPETRPPETPAPPTPAPETSVPETPTATTSGSANESMAAPPEVRQPMTLAPENQSLPTTTSLPATPPPPPPPPPAPPATDPWAMFSASRVKGIDDFDFAEVIRSALRVRDPDLASGDPFREARPSKFNYTLGGNFSGLYEMPAVPLYEPAPGKRSWISIVTGVGMGKKNSPAARRAGFIQRAGMLNKVLYCRRHNVDLYGFDLHALVRDGMQGRVHGPHMNHVQWGKTLAMLRVLPLHEWLLWVDNDMYVMKLQMSPMALIDGVTKLPRIPPFEGPPTPERAPNDVDEGSDQPEPPLDDYQEEEGAGSEVHLLMPSEGAPDQLANIVPNTAFYAVRRSLLSLEMFNETWYAPPNQFVGANDQDAFALLLGQSTPHRERCPVVTWQAAQRRPTGFWRRHARNFAPLHLVGGWIALGKDVEPWRTFSYGDPIVHFSVCDFVNHPEWCAPQIGHTLAVWLALNGFTFTSSTPANTTLPEGAADLNEYLQFPRIPPEVSGPGTPFNPAVAANVSGPRVIIVSDAARDGLPAVRLPKNVSRALRASKVRLAQRAGASFDDRYYHELGVRNRAKLRSPEMDLKWGLRLAEGWLPYYDWVVYMTPDVGVAAAESLDLNALIARVPDHVDVVAQSVHGGFVDWREGAADCSVLLLRRSTWTFELLQRIYDQPEATCEESLKRIVDWSALPFEPVRTRFRYLAQLYGQQRPDALLVRQTLGSVLGVRHLVRVVPGLCDGTVAADCAAYTARPVPAVGSTFGVRVPIEACMANATVCGNLVAAAMH